MYNFNKKSRVAINTIRTMYGGRSKAIEAANAAGYVLRDDGYFYQTLGSALMEEVTYSELPELDGGLILPEIEDAPVQSHIPETHRPLVVTSYLIGTVVPDHIWKSIENLVSAIDARLVIIAHRYKNPTTLEASIRRQEKAEYIDPRVVPYLSWEDFECHNHHIRCSIQVNCTTLNPLPQISKSIIGHSVIGHSMQNMKILPCVGERMPYVIWSTGTISQIDEAKNLKASISQFHYKFGAIIVDTEGSSRNVHMTKSGCWTDKDIKYDGNQIDLVSDGDIQAVIWGDLHHGFTCKETLEWGKKLTRQLSPVKLILHDFLDGNTVNPHASRTEQTKIWDNLAEEVDSARDMLCELVNEEVKDRQILPPLAKYVKLVQSNHNDMLSRYLSKTPVNELHHKEIPLLARWIKYNRSPEELLVAHIPQADICRESDNIGHIRLDLHGDVGINGSRGNLLQFFNAGICCAVGHSHTPGILGGANQLGTFTRRKIGYNDKGASSWLQSLVSVNIYRKVQHFIRFF